MADSNKPSPNKAFPSVFGSAIDLVAWEPDYQRIEDAVGYIDPKRVEFPDHGSGLGSGKRLKRSSASS